MAKTKAKSKPAQAKKKWIQAAHLKEGALSETLGVPEKKNIPVKKLKKAAKGNSKTAKRARLALTLKKISRKRKKSK